MTYEQTSVMPWAVTHHQLIYQRIDSHPKTSPNFESHLKDTPECAQILNLIALRGLLRALPSTARSTSYCHGNHF